MATTWTRKAIARKTNQHKDLQKTYSANWRRVQESHHLHVDDIYGKVFSHVMCMACHCIYCVIVWSHQISNRSTVLVVNTWSNQLTIDGRDHDATNHSS